ncbi:MAG: inositol monophosphatase family protein [Microthrixaceae bacterium]
MASEPAQQDLMGVLRAAADTASSSFGALRGRVDASDLRAGGTRAGQYALDLTVDEAVLGTLRSEAARRGLSFRVLSEESGLTGPAEDLTVVVDPVDGSSNASRGLPWFACALCVLDDQGPWVSLVRNLATGTTWEALRGGGARRDGTPISCASTTAIGDAFVVLNGHSPRHFGWRQYRAMGATALDICAVADGSVDATIDCTTDALGPWDYMGAMLVLTEAGGHIADATGRDLVVLDPAQRRTPVSACTESLFEAALAARRSI